MSLWRCSLYDHIDWLCMEQCLDPGRCGVIEGAGLPWLPATACGFKMPGSQLQARIKHLPGVHLLPAFIRVLPFLSLPGLISVAASWRWVP